MEEILLKEFKELYLNNEVQSFFEYRIDKIEENFGEYCLTLRVGNFKIKGIFSKIKDKLIEEQTLSLVKFYLDKSNEEIKVYVNYSDIKSSNTEKNRGKIIKVYNLNPEFLQNTINNLGLFKGELNNENVFIFEKIVDNKIKLFDPIEIKHYYLDKKYTENITLNYKEFIYLKFI